MPLSVLYLQRWEVEHLKEKIRLLKLALAAEKEALNKGKSITYYVNLYLDVLIINFYVKFLFHFEKEFYAIFQLISTDELRILFLLSRIHSMQGSHTTGYKTKSVYVLVVNKLFCYSTVCNYLMSSSFFRWRKT